jgi:hypothetical protein
MTAHPIAIAAVLVLAACSQTATPPLYPTKDTLVTIVAPDSISDGLGTPSERVEMTQAGGATTPTTANAVTSQRTTTTPTRAGGGTSATDDAQPRTVGPRDTPEHGGAHQPGPPPPPPGDPCGVSCK